MKMIRATLFTFGSCALAATMFAPAYMKFGDIKGEAAAVAKDVHKGEIEILSFSFGESNAGSARDAASGQATGKRDAASGLPTGKRQHKPVSVTKPVDKASPILAKALRTGESIGMIELSDGTTVHKLHDCVVTSISPVANSAGDRPMESLSLNYAKIESVPAPKARAKAGEAKERAKADKPARTSG